VERLAPFSPGHIDPKKHQIGSLRIGKSLMNDPGVGVEISAGQRQRAGDQQRLLAGKRYCGGLRDHKTRRWFGQESRHIAEKIIPVEDSGLT
jgi:hypothetical protein